MSGDYVRACGVSIVPDAGGYYKVSFWVKPGLGKAMRSTSYYRLSWTEACDVMLAECDRYRPGSVMTHGWVEPAIDFGGRLD